MPATNESPAPQVTGASGERQPGPLVGVATLAASGIDALDLGKERPPPSEMARGAAAR
jgi:hypothetical protein